MVEHSSTGILILIFISAALLVGSLTRQLLKKTTFPYTVALLFIGLLMGFWGKFLAKSNSDHLLVQVNHMIGEIDPKLVLFIFLPILIFESAFSLDVHLFRRLFTQISVLAVPCLIVATALTAFVIKYAFPWDWSWPICLMFGALISATDPVAVVALLKEISSRKRLETLIEGESLLNDGTAIVLFSIFYILATDPSLSFSLLNVTIDFFVIICSGVVIGMLMGFITVFWWGHVFNDPMIEISLSIISTFASFLIAEHVFHVSGVVAVVTCAIILAGYGSTKVSPEVSGFLHRFWKMIGFIAETVIFLIVGIVIAYRVTLDDPHLWYMLGILYLSIMLIRVIAVAIFYPILKTLSISFNLTKAVVLVWGGLRGVVGLTLALAVIQDPRISSELGDQILFLTAGIVVLTIAINGTTMLSVVTWLGLDKLPIAKFLTVRRAKLKIAEDLRKYYPTLKENEILQGAHWWEVESVSGIDDIINKEDIKAEGEALLHVVEEDLVKACKKRILETEKRNYWLQLKQGMLGNTATRLLIKSVDQALDNEPVIAPRLSLQKYWKLPNILSKLNRILILKKIILNHSFSRLAIGYEVAKGFLHAQDEMINNLPSIAPDIETRNQIIKDIKKNKEMTHEHIDKMRKAYPEILSRLETYSASRSMLYKKRHIIEQLVDLGLLDEAETKKMIAHVEQKMQRLGTEVTNKLSIDSKSLVKSHESFQFLDNKTFAQIEDKMINKFYSYPETIAEQNISPGGLIYIVGGRVDVYKMVDGAKRYINTMGAGTIMGVNSIKTGKFEYTIKANTSVEIMFIPANVLKSILEENIAFRNNLQKPYDDTRI